MKQTICYCDIYGCMNPGAEHFEDFTVIFSDKDTGLKYFDNRDIDICKECQEKILNSGSYVFARTQIDKLEIRQIYEINWQS